MTAEQGNQSGILRRSYGQSKELEKDPPEYLTRCFVMGTRLSLSDDSANLPGTESSPGVESSPCAQVRRRPASE
jgi:hypothetical protein